MVGQTANSEVARFAAASPARDRQLSSILFSKQHVYKTGTAKSATLIRLSLADGLIGDSVLMLTRFSSCLRKLIAGESNE
jgi:hypothetical protein